MHAEIGLLLIWAEAQAEGAQYADNIAPRLPLSEQVVQRMAAARWRTRGNRGAIVTAWRDAFVTGFCDRYAQRAPFALGLSLGGATAYVTIMRGRSGYVARQGWQQVESRESALDACARYWAGQAEGALSQEVALTG